MCGPSHGDASSRALSLTPTARRRTALQSRIPIDDPLSESSIGYGEGISPSSFLLLPCRRRGCRYDDIGIYGVETRHSSKVGTHDSCGCLKPARARLMHSRGFAVSGGGWGAGSKPLFGPASCGHRVKDDFRRLRRCRYVCRVQRPRPQV